MSTPCRIGCVRIGRFAIGALAPAERPSAAAASASAPPRPTGQSPGAEPARVLVRDLRGKPRVVAVCAVGARSGITPGMTLEQAKALAADLVHGPWDEERLARAALEVTGALLAASPRIKWESGRVGEWERYRDEGVWWVDAAGLGEEKNLAQRLLRIAKQLNFGSVHVGIADSAIAAYAATFRSPTFPLSHSPTLTRLVPSGRDADFLAPYPLRLLDLDEDLAETFAALGLRTLGQVAALEPGEVEARFGPAGLAAHRLALGLDARGPAAPRELLLPSAECDLGAAVATAEPLLFVLKGALASLGSALRARALAAREVTITLTLDSGERSARAVRPARPTSHEDALFDHCRAALEGWSLPEPVTAIALAATLTVPAGGEQGNLLRSRWADPAALEAAFDRIRGREGAVAVAVPSASDGHLPEDAGAWKERGIEKTGRAFSVVRSPGLSIPRFSTALRLLETPALVRVRLGRAGLEAFRAGEVWHDVATSSGPERLVPRWWRSDAHHGVRDYFTARTTDGTLWLLFRAGPARRWFVGGWWD